MRGEPLPHLRSRKGQWLLALLVLRSGREVDRSWLAGTLWPESAEGDALYSLRRSLTDLRAALGPEAERLGSPGPRTLRLDLDGAFADLLHFDGAVARGDTTSLEEAVALYTGPLLEGCVEEWLLPERAARETAYLAALDRLADAAQAAGDPASAARYFRLAVGQDPYREPAVRGLMQALGAQGDYAGAARAYDALRRVLRRELDAEPAGDTTALFQRLQEEAQSAVHAAAPRRPSLLRAPEAPVLRPQPLLQPVSTLVGREVELKALADCLGRSRLVTLTGPGGIGKSRLALAAGAAGAGGAAYVDFGALADEDLVPAVAALALGLAERPGRDALATLLEALREQRLLLLLDNCEHLLPACATLARTLLEGCGGLRVLATSREPLRLSGETVWPVPALSLPHSTAPPEALAQSEAVRLFLDRARAARPGFALTAENAEAVSNICRRLDGIPLAIELAAARVRVLAPEQIADRLDDRFSLLTAGGSAVPSRQQTLRAAMDWSYDLLSPGERLLFRRLAVFSGGWTLAAAEDVCSGPDLDARAVLETLSRLLDRSLADTDAAGTPGEARYRMLETIRAYARERLQEAGEGARLQERHAAFFLKEAEARDGAPDLAAWLDRLERELDNLRGALAWYGSAGDAGLGLKMAGLLWPFWDLRGHWSEGREYLAGLLAREAESRAGETLAPERPGALIGAGNLARRQGEYGAARALYDEALACARALHDRAGEGRALHEIGLWSLLQGDAAEAEARYLESLEIARALGNRRRVAALTNDLGEAARLLGDYPTARRRYEECLAEAQETGDSRAEAGALANLGNLAAEHENWPRARRLGEWSLALLRRLGDRWGEALVLNNLGLAALGLADLTAARACLRDSLALRRELGDRWGTAHSLEALASLASAEGRWEQSARLFGAAEALRERVGFAIDPSDRRHHEARVAALHAALGPDAMDEAWSEGRLMRLDEVLDGTV